MFGKLFGKKGSKRSKKSRREQDEIDDFSAALIVLMQQRGMSVAAANGWVVENQTGIQLHPELIDFLAIDGQGGRSCTTLHCVHPQFFPNGVFEYQHSTGNTPEESIVAGFDQWLQLDFPVLADALQAEPATCTSMEMTFPGEGEQPTRQRRVLLGPVLHMGIDQGETGSADASGEACHSSSCSCCLFTNSFQAFESQLKSNDDFFAIRLFASRDETGAVQADCRVNGEDWEPGAAALRKYAGSWPANGFEFRKQYIAIQSVSG